LSPSSSSPAVAEDITLKRIDWQLQPSPNLQGLVEYRPPEHCLVYVLDCPIAFASHPASKMAML
jgi:hypothetical protein